MLKRTTAVIACVLMMAVSVPALAASPQDEEGIRSAALDYLLGWYTGDAERMEKALHADLAKRIVRADPKGRWDRVENMSALTLVQYTRKGYGKKVPEGERVAEIKILDVYDNAATVRAEARDWIDYLHIGKVNGEWKIINVLWVMKPKPETENKPSGE